MYVLTQHGRKHIQYEYVRDTCMYIDQQTDISLTTMYRQYVCVCMYLYSVTESMSNTNMQERGKHLAEIYAQIY